MWRSRFTQTTDDIADRKLSRSIQENKLYPDNLLPTLSDAEEGQPGYEAAETYPLINSDLLSPPLVRRGLLTTTGDFPFAASDTTLSLHTKKMPDRHYLKEPIEPLPFTTKRQPVHTAEEAYPLINSELLSPPSVRRGLLTNTGDFPFAASDTTLPLHTKKMPDRHYLKESIDEPLPFTTKRQSVHTADEAHPVSIKNLFLSPEARVGLPDTTSELLRHTHASSSSTPLDTKQTLDRLEAEGNAEVVSPYVEESGSLSLPDVYQSYRIRKVDQRQIKGVEDKLAYVKWQPQHTDLSQRLSRVLRPITQRMTFLHRPMEAHPQVTGEGISEGHAFSTQHFYHPKAIETQGEPNTVIAGQVAMPLLANMSQIGVSGTPILQAVHALPALARSKQLAKIERKSSVRTSPAWHKPVARSSVELAGQNIAFGYQTEGVADVSQSSDTLNLVTPEHGSIGEGYTRGQVNRTLLYREPSSFAGSTIRPLPVHKSSRHMMISPSQQLFKSEAYAPLSGRSEEYGFLYKQEYVPSSPGNKNVRQPALELPVASSIEPKAKFSGAPGEELLTNMYTTIPELPSSRYPNVTELALAPVGSTPVTASSQIARQEEHGAEGIEQEGEHVAAPDIDAIAVDVYGILKRRLMAERERALGVY